MREEETASVPKFIAEISSDFKFFRGVDDRAIFLLFFFHRKTHVLVVGAKASHHEAERIGSVFLFDVHRVNAIALGFAHRLTIAVENLRVNVNGVERYRAHVFLREQHHAGDPKRNDVAACDENGSRVVTF